MASAEEHAAKVMKATGSPSRSASSTPSSTPKHTPGSTPKHEKKIRGGAPSELIKDGISAVPTDNDFIYVEVEKASSVLPTMWLGSQSGRSVSGSLVSVPSPRQSDMNGPQHAQGSTCLEPQPQQTFTQWVENLFQFVRALSSVSVETVSTFCEVERLCAQHSVSISVCFTYFLLSSGHKITKIAAPGSFSISDTSRVEYWWR